MNESLLIFETTVTDSENKIYFLSMDLDHNGIVVLKLEYCIENKETLLCAKDLKPILQGKSQHLFEEIAIKLNEGSYSLEAEGKRFLLKTKPSICNSEVSFLLIDENELDGVDDSVEATIEEEIESFPADIKEMYKGKGNLSLINGSNIKTLFNIGYAKETCTSWSANNLTLSSFSVRGCSYLIMPSEKNQIVVYDVNQEAVHATFTLSSSDKGINILKFKFVPWSRKFVILVHFAFESVVNLYEYNFNLNKLLFIKQYGNNASISDASILLNYKTNSVNVAVVYHDLKKCVLFPFMGPTVNYALNPGMNTVVSYSDENNYLIGVTCNNSFSLINALEDKRIFECQIDAPIQHANIFVTETLNGDREIYLAFSLLKEKFVLKNLRGWPSYEILKPKKVILGSLFVNNEIIAFFDSEKVYFFDLKEHKEIFNLKFEEGISALTTFWHNTFGQCIAVHEKNTNLLKFYGIKN